MDKTNNLPDLSKLPPNPPAFPTTWDTSNQFKVDEGMTLRDYFAAKALNGLLSNPTLRSSFGASYEEENANLAKACYSIADSMLKQREL